MRNKLILFAGILLLAFHVSNGQERREIGNLVLEDIPEIPEEIKTRIQQYQNTRTAGLADWLPDDKGIMISTRFGNTTQLHAVDEPGGARKQITFYDEPVGNASFCPDPNHDGFLFTKDIGGNEFSQIFWYDMKTRSAKMISDGNSVNFGILWSNEGDRFAFTSTRRNSKDFDVYVSDMATPEKAELKIDRGVGYWIPMDWSPDDSKLLLMQYISSTKTNSYVLDLSSNDLVQLNDGDKESVFIASEWNGDGTKIYARSNERTEFETLVEYDLVTGETKDITSDLPWDVEGIAMNKDASLLAFTANENGFSQLYVMDVASGTYKKAQNIPVGQVFGLNFHPERNVLGLVINSTSTPGDVYSLDLVSQNITRWTHSEVGGLDTTTFPEPELIHYNTYDEVDGNPRKIPAFVYRPRNLEGPLPVMISIHGGPESQHVPIFRSFYAFLANELGIAVIAPNVRGSSGYGKTYLKLDNDFKREDSVKDIGHLIRWIEQNEDFDSDRIGVYGGSYGGYMVLSSLFNYNEKIKCGVDIVGISNFVTFLENTEEYRRDARRVEYGDERDPDMRKHLEAISPNNHAEKITKPLFVIQGANDPRVPASESEQMVAAIRENGGTVWYMLAKDEGHGFRKKVNRDRMTEAIALFLQEHLLK